MKKLYHFYKRSNSIAILLFLLGSQHIFSASEREMLILGDSLSAGYGIPAEKQWVKLVQEKLDAEDKNLKLINASVSGETTKGGLLRLPALLETYSLDFLFIELGANDGLRGYPAARVKSNLLEMCNLAKNEGIDIFIMEIIVAPNYGTKYMNHLERVYEEVSNECKARLVPPLLNENIVLNKDLMLPDGIHPNTQGQMIIADDLYSWISKL